VHLLAMIERYLRESGIPASRFGRDAMGDPGFVATLRRGRQPRDRTIERVSAYIRRARSATEAGR